MHIFFTFIVYKTPISGWSPIQCVSSFFSKTFVGKPLTINTDVYVYSKHTDYKEDESPQYSISPNFNHVNSWLYKLGFDYISL